MSIWNKVLLGLLMVMTLPFIFVAARTLKTEQSWREAANQLESQIKQLTSENERLLEGDATNEGIRQVSNKLFEITMDRGRAWFGSQPVEPQVDEEKRSATVTLSLAEGYDAQNIEDELVMYLFEETGIEEGGRYLGEFKVTGVGEGQVVVSSTLPLNDEQLQRVGTPQGTWTMYEVMPLDRHEVWTYLDEATIRKLLPDDVEEEYVKDGKPAAADDPPERVVDGKYQRPLRSYAALFYELDRLRTIDTDRIAAMQKDIEFLKAAVADAQTQQQYRREEIARLKQDVERITRQNDAVASLRDRLRQSLEQTREQVAATLEANKRMARQFAQWQFEAAAAIDRETAKP